MSRKHFLEICLTLLSPWEHFFGIRVGEPHPHPSKGTKDMLIDMLSKNSNTP